MYSAIRTYQPAEKLSAQVSIQRRKPHLSWSLPNIDLITKEILQQFYKVVEMVDTLLKDALLITKSQTKTSKENNRLMKKYQRFRIKLNSHLLLFPSRSLLLL